MSRIFFYNSYKGLLKRLPEHYKKRYLQEQNFKPVNPYFKQPEHEYYRSKQDGQLHHWSEIYQEPEIFRTPQYERCIVGLEGFVYGVTYRDKKGFRCLEPTFVHPDLEEHLFYSDLLKTWLRVNVTRNVLKSIEEARDFDTYILKSHEKEMNSKLANSLKRQMLINLAKITNENDPLRVKFKDFIIPLEEAEWVGLSLEDAVDKLQIKEALSKPPLIPVKISLTKIFLENLKAEQAGIQ